MNDVIIVGAGTAGCVLAERLSNSGRLRVMLIEAGGAPSSPFVKMPAGFAKLFKSKTELAHKDGRRFSAYDAYLKPAMQRANLEVLRDAHVLRVEIANGRATGVTVRRDGVEKTFPARGVILAAFELFAPGTNLPLPPDEKRVTRMAEALRMVWLGYRAKPLDRSLLAEVDAPVYLPVGGSSTSRMKAVAEVLAKAFPKACVEVFAERHHFDLLHRAAEDFAAGLEKTWSEEEQTQ